MKHISNYKPEFAAETSRWRAVVERNPASDGAFLYGVTTTGIYCRPVCSSRLPNRENVQFFDHWHQAEADGFRACKRCRPRETKLTDHAVEAVAEACALIEEAEIEPTLDQLAETVGLSTYHFHRLFKRILGVTPKQYAVEKRLGRVRANLQKEATVTDAIYDAGYGSGSRFYEKAESTLGMKPSEYKQGGKGLTIRYAVARSYLGWVLIAVTERGICRIDIDDAPENLIARLKDHFPQAEVQVADAKLKTIVEQTLAFLEAPERGLGLPLDVQGTAFQRRVWTALQDIQPGSTKTYGEIAELIGDPKVARAVAGACAANKIAVVIPCHRVVRSDGGLGGYRWGIQLKQALLDRESNNSE